MKRYCQYLELRDDKQLIADYVQAHQNVWSEIKNGIREVGILDMQIYLHGNKLFMIVDTVDEFDWEKDNARLATLPRQAEWETKMSVYQQAAPDEASHQKWKLMPQVFKL